MPWENPPTADDILAASEKTVLTKQYSTRQKLDLMADEIREIADSTRATLELAHETRELTRALVDFTRTVQAGIDGMKQSPMFKLMPGMTNAMDAFGTVQMPDT